MGNMDGMAVADTPDKPRTREQERIDHNRSRRLALLRRLDQALTQAMRESFRGTVAVEVSSKDGRLAMPKVTVAEFCDE